VQAEYVFWRVSIEQWAIGALPTDKEVGDGLVFLLTLKLLSLKDDRGLRAHHWEVLRGGVRFSSFHNQGRAGIIQIIRGREGGDPHLHLSKGGEAFEVADCQLDHVQQVVVKQSSQNDCVGSL
jgi:hypothetical protein